MESPLFVYSFIGCPALGSFHFLAVAIMLPKRFMCMFLCGSVFSFTEVRTQLGVQLLSLCSPHVVFEELCDSGLKCQDWFIFPWELPPC